jgi:sugar O-acyltransferase (sialic acid O-acetyltransferase NeuD family)
VHRESLPETGELLGMPVVAFEDLAELYPPATHSMFVAIGYSDLNRNRARVCGEARDKGYELVSYVSSSATHWGDTQIGDNCFISDDNTIQPSVTIGDGVVLWLANRIAHHAVLGDYCYLTTQVVVSGYTRIGDFSFVGANATLRDGITIGRANVIGAGALIMRSTGDDEVYVGDRTTPSDARSDEVEL